MDINKVVSINIKKVRLAYGLSLKEVADTVGKSHQVVYKYESGLNKVSLDVLQKLSKLYNLPIYAFLDEGLSCEVSYNKEKP